MFSAEPWHLSGFFQKRKYIKKITNQPNLVLDSGNEKIEEILLESWNKAIGCDGISEHMLLSCDDTVPLLVILY